MLVHDLKSPISSIRGFATTISHAVKSGKADPDKIAGYCERVVHLGERMVALVDTLHEYTKSEAHVEFAPVVLNLVVEDALTNLDQIISKSGARVTKPGRRFCDQAGQDIEVLAGPDRGATAGPCLEAPIAATKQGLGRMAPKSRARSGGGASDPAIGLFDQARISPAGNRNLLSAGDRSRRRYLWLAADDNFIGGCFGLPTPPATVHRLRCLPPWPNFFFIMAANSRTSRLRSWERSTMICAEFPGAVRS